TQTSSCFAHNTSEEGRSKSISRIYVEFEALPEYWIVLRFSAPIAFAALRRRVRVFSAIRSGGKAANKIAIAIPVRLICLMSEFPMNDVKCKCQTTQLTELPK